MKQCCSIHFWGEELLVAVIDFYLNWLGIRSPGVPNLFGCFTLKFLDGPESSEPWAIQSIYFAPKKKRYFQWFQKNRSLMRLLPNSNAYQIGMTSPSLQLSSCGASDPPWDPCQNVTDPGFDNAPGKSLLSKTQLEGESSKLIASSYCGFLKLPFSMQKVKMNLARDGGKCMSSPKKKWYAEIISHPISWSPIYSKSSNFH